jgi:hypothetical protein
MWRYPSTSKPTTVTTGANLGDLVAVRAGAGQPAEFGAGDHEGPEHADLGAVDGGLGLTQDALRLSDLSLAGEQSSQEAAGQGRHDARLRSAAPVSARRNSPEKNSVS